MVRELKWKEEVTMEVNMKKVYIILIVSILALKSYAQDDWLQGYRDATIAFGKISEGNLKNPITNKIEINSIGEPKKYKFFQIAGTGVIFANPDTTDKLPYIVTAKHVLFSPKKNWDPDNIRIRFSWFSEKSVITYHGIEIKLKENGEHLWTPHPNKSVDLAILQLKIKKIEAGRSSVDPVTINNIATRNEAFEGASILVFGYPGAVGEGYWTQPLVRHGIISHVNYKQFGQTPLLIDAMLYPGNSGGPVFTVPSGMARMGNFKVGGASRLLGIVSLGFLHTMDIGTTPISLMPTSIDSTNIHYQSFEFIGLSVVEPASRIIELFESIKNN